MKLCIPTEDKTGMDAKVCGHFGSAPFFTIVDVEGGSFRVLDNVNAHHAHGMCHPVAVLGTEPVDAVVCQGMGMRAIMKLNEGGIKAYRTPGGTVAEIVRKYADGELEEMTAENACGHHGCH
jgi:predicted Fe-Mo cluster-binding NifX family protein